MEGDEAVILSAKPAACGGVVALALIACPVLQARADATPLNVNPGLWEMTTTSHTAGQMPLPEDMLAKMAPEQRAKVEAAMKAMMERAAAPHTFKECVTAQQIKDGLKLGQKDQPSCKRTVLSQSSTLLQVREECTGARPSTANYRFEAPNPAAMHGIIDMVMGQGTRTMKVNGDVQGKWLGADCGSVKPGSPQME